MMNLFPPVAICANGVISFTACVHGETTHFVISGGFDLCREGFQSNAGSCIDDRRRRNKFQESVISGIGDDRITKISDIALLISTLTSITASIGFILDTRCSVVLSQVS